MIRYSGKRATLVAKIIDEILKKNIPIRTLIEPFAGSLQLARSFANKNIADEFKVAEANPILRNIWSSIQQDPLRFENEVVSLLENLPKIPGRGRKLDPTGVAIVKDWFDKGSKGTFEEAVKDYAINAASVRSVPGHAPYVLPELSIPSNKLINENISGLSRVMKKANVYDDWKDAVTEIDKNDFLYIDPPYLGLCKYRGGFPKQERQLLTSFVESIVGKPSVGFVFDSPRGAAQMSFLDWKPRNDFEFFAQIGRNTLQL